MNPIKDKAALIASALVVAGISWTYFHYAGEWGTQWLFVIAFFILLIDNRRLRNQLKKNDESAVPTSKRSEH
ncbi:hypothetical protein ACS7SF_11625 [Ralstonia sp. 25C]|uniref:hypothetical protein n=1 Tax=Ralstonia sp. 25C TaxID=3447363 RepID=UPI003F74FCC8